MLSLEAARARPPADLLEAQLFGHLKGSFTGAVKDEVGFVRSAHTGTLFLDEIADLPPSSQAALLRVLQEGEVTPVGSTRGVQVDVRVVVATHRDLTELMAAGHFRRDLYARLAGFSHTMPPLAERREDLGLLIGALLARHSGHSQATINGTVLVGALFQYFRRYCEDCRYGERASYFENVLCGLKATSSASSQPDGTSVPSANGWTSQAPGFLGSGLTATRSAARRAGFEVSGCPAKIRFPTVGAFDEGDGSVTECGGLEEAGISVI